MGWSHDLLTVDEKRLFRRMADFQGGCALEAVEQVCTAAQDLGMDILDGVASLIDKNLLYSVEGVEGEPRYWMLETIHEYACEPLEGSSAR
jgi:predicted ATPase